MEKGNEDIQHLSDDEIEQSRQAALQRLNEDTAKVGIQRGELVQNKDGSTSVKYKIELSGTLRLEGHMQATKTHKSQVKNWLLIISIWIVTVGIQAITSFWITGLPGMISGIVLSAIPFFLGFWAVKTIIEKETWHS